MKSNDSSTALSILQPKTFEIMPWLTWRYQVKHEKG